jgi:SAM-dependent methyltransferase
MLVATYTLTIFVSASLLFLIQPLFGRMILPELGGTPAVWNTALVFYQATLLGGYLYAHLSTRRLGPRRQAVWHLGLMLLPLAVLPIAIRRLGEAPVEGTPVWWLLATLALSVGLPFFMISAASPLLQRWFSQTRHRQASDPYFLYSASNLGSFAGLFAYPFLLEPNLPLRHQSVLWSVGYGAALLLTGLCVWLLRREPAPDAKTEAPAAPAPAARRKVRWVLLAFVPSALMMGVTTFLSTDVAAVPLLWAMPLGAYLLTFMLAFARRPWIPVRLLAWLAPAVMVLATVILLAPLHRPVWLLALAGLGAFLLAALACHAELAADRPEPEHLTGFFLWVSVGGVLGGAFCGLLAPMVFDRVLEYTIALILGVGMLPRILPKLRPRLKRPWAMDLAAPVALALLTWGSYALYWSHHLPDAVPRGAWVPLLIPSLVCLAMIARPPRAALGLAGMGVVAVAIGYLDYGVVHLHRDFFGSIRVTDMPFLMRRQFIHGTTIHAIQSLDPVLALKPTGYYHWEGPMGEAFDTRRRPARASVGVVGLGAGAVAAFARPGERWTFFEISPAVVEVAENPALFTYLRDMRAPYRVVLGDARLRLDRETEKFDILVLAAYSSDTIPVHLITREAMQVYLRRLRPGGIIAMHIGNRYMEIEPVVAGLARDAGLVARLKGDWRTGWEYEMRGVVHSLWVVLARRPEDLGPLNEANGWRELRIDPRVPLWTDDYSSIVSVLRILR